MKCVLGHNEFTFYPSTLHPLNLKLYLRDKMIFAHNQFVILDLFGGNTIFFLFFNNITITVLHLKSKHSEPLIQELYGNFNFIMNSWITLVLLLCLFVSLYFRGLIVISLWFFLTKLMLVWIEKFDKTFFYISLTFIWGLIGIFLYIGIYWRQS